MALWVRLRLQGAPEQPCLTVPACLLCRIPVRLSSQLASVRSREQGLART